MTRGELVLQIRGRARAVDADKRRQLWAMWHAEALRRKRRIGSLSALMARMVDKPTPEEFDEAAEAHEDIVRRMG